MLHKYCRLLFLVVKIGEFGDCLFTKMSIMHIILTRWHSMNNTMYKKVVPPPLSSGQYTVVRESPTPSPMAVTSSKACITRAFLTTSITIKRLKYPRIEILNSHNRKK